MLFIDIKLTQRHHYMYKFDRTLNISRTNCKTSGALTSPNRHQMSRNSDNINAAIENCDSSVLLDERSVVRSRIYRQYLQFGKELGARKYIRDFAENTFPTGTRLHNFNLSTHSL